MEKTPHVYVGKEITYDNTGIVRGFAAVCTFGMTESAWADRFWQCEICGLFQLCGG